MTGLGYKGIYWFITPGLYRCGQCAVGNWAKVEEVEVAAMEMRSSRKKSISARDVEPGAKPMLYL